MKRIIAVLLLALVVAARADAGPTYFPVVGVASANDLQLTNTASTTVLTYSNTSAGNYILHWRYRVVTATTNVTLTVSWTSQDGTAQTLTYSSASAKAVGVHPCTSVSIGSQASAAITVTAQAGTANQVFVSAVLEQQQ